MINYCRANFKKLKLPFYEMENLVGSAVDEQTNENCFDTYL